MKIMSPVDNFSEAELLIDNGAEELYGGYVPDFWEEKYGHVASLNRRSYSAANIPTASELDKILEVCKGRGIPFFLVLNAPLVPESEIGPVIQLAFDCEARGVSGFIVSDLNLLASLAESGLNAELHAGTLFAVFSHATVRFLEALGASRVVLSRELALGETRELSEKGGKVKLDVIAFRGKCPNIEGYCSHLHDDPDRRWPCELPYRKKWVGAFDKNLKDEVFENISEWEGVDRYFSCGICALPLLDNAGIHSAKIVGRGSEMERKLRAVKVLKKTLDFCRGEKDLARCITVGRSIYVEEFGRPCSRKNCYFPEFFNGSEK